MIIERLTYSDIPRAMQFVEAAGWNQTPAIWQRFIDYQSAGCFKAILNGQMVGTVTSTSYGRALAWIGMMLVAPEARRRGVGGALMQHVLDYLHAEGIQTIRLDATPMGRPLYESLGFVAQYDFYRWRREPTNRAEHVAQVAPQDAAVGARSTPAVEFAQVSDNLLQLDKRGFGVERWDWLRRTAEGALLITSDHGFGMLRSGRINQYLGPVTADSYSSAMEIIGQLCASTSQPIIWDIPQVDPQLYAGAMALRFTQQRVLTRMCWQRDQTEPDLSLQWAICDPASG